jgi:hypothetical protein
MSADIAGTVRTTGEASKRTFFHHYLEMVVVMVVAMAILGAAVSLLFAILGHSSLLHYTGRRAFVMTANMTIGLVLWMRFRWHRWATTAEMAGAMVLPYVLLIGPYSVGVLSGGAFLGVMHLLMLPFMFMVMLRRFDEYAQHHGPHPSWHVPAPSH